MATGDRADILARLKAPLGQTRWFPTPNGDGSTGTPVLDGVLSGCASAWAWCYALIGYARAQARRLTASGVFLDMLAADFFGAFIRRRTNETDAALSGRIGRELFREKGTRAGLIKALLDLTGRTPHIFEPAYPLDTGGYGSLGMTAGTGLAYGVAGGVGGYGSLLLPFQFFVTAFRPSGQGVANVGGYYLGSGWAGGGYGVGALEYVSHAMIAAPVTDADIYAEVNDVRPVATIAWTAISS